MAFSNIIQVKLSGVGHVILTKSCTFRPAPYNVKEILAARNMPSVAFKLEKNEGRAVS
jgi:hypothetical protein